MDVKQCINITLTTVKYLFVGLCILGSGAYLAYALTLDLHKNVVLLSISCFIIILFLIWLLKSQLIQIGNLFTKRWKKLKGSYRVIKHMRR